jgi:hypothetical protein
MTRFDDVATKVAMTLVSCSQGWAVWQGRGILKAV